MFSLVYFQFDTLFLFSKINAFFRYIYLFIYSSEDSKSFANFLSCALILKNYISNIREVLNKSYKYIKIIANLIFECLKSLDKEKLYYLISQISLFQKFKIFLYAKAML